MQQADCKPLLNWQQLHKIAKVIGHAEVERSCFCNFIHSFHRNSFSSLYEKGLLFSYQTTRGSTHFTAAWHPINYSKLPIYAVYTRTSPGGRTICEHSIFISNYCIITMLALEVYIPIHWLRPTPYNSHYSYVHVLGLILSYNWPLGGTTVSNRLGYNSKK